MVGDTIYNIRLFHIDIYLSCPVVSWDDSQADNADYDTLSIHSVPYELSCALLSVQFSFPVLLMLSWFSSDQIYAYNPALRENLSTIFPHRSSQWVHRENPGPFGVPWSHLLVLVTQKRKTGFLFIFRVVLRYSVQRKSQDKLQHKLYF